MDRLFYGHIGNRIMVINELIFIILYYMQLYSSSICSFIVVVFLIININVFISS